MERINDKERIRLPVGIITEETILVPYSDEELEELRKELVLDTYNMLLKISEKKEVVKILNWDIKQLANAIEEKTNGCVTGQKKVNLSVSSKANDDEGTIEYFDLVTGELVHSRRQFPSERASLFPENQG